MDGHRVARIDLQPVAIQGGGFLATAEQHERAKHLVATDVMARPAGDGLAVGDQPVVDLAGFDERAGQRIPALGVVGVGAYRGTGGFGGFVQAAEATLQRGQVGPSARHTGCEREAFPVGSGGVLEGAGLEQHVAQVVPHAGPHRVVGR